MISSTSTAASSKSSKPRKPYYKPTQNGGKKADGTWDKRTKIGREALAREKELAANKAKAEEKKVDLAGYEGKLRKDGLPDKRTEDGKLWHDTHKVAQQAVSSSLSSSQYSGYDGPKTKSGAPDMRFSAAKAYVASQSTSLSTSFAKSTSSYSGYTGPMTKSGAPDMRFSEAKAYVASSSSTSFSMGGGGGSSSYKAPASISSSSSFASYSGPVTKSGAPDMRTTAGKAWAASNK